MIHSRICHVPSTWCHRPLESPCIRQLWMKSWSLANIDLPWALHLPFARLNEIYSTYDGYFFGNFFGTSNTAHPQVLSHSPFCQALAMKYWPGTICTCVLPSWSDAPFPLLGSLLNYKLHSGYRLSKSTGADYTSLSDGRGRHCDFVLFVTVSHSAEVTSIRKLGGSFLCESCGIEDNAGRARPPYRKTTSRWRRRDEKRGSSSCQKPFVPWKPTETSELVSFNFGPQHVEKAWVEGRTERSLRPRSVLSVD